MNKLNPFSNCIVPGFLAGLAGVFLLALALGAFATQPAAQADTAPAADYARQLRAEVAANAALIATVNAAPVRTFQRGEAAALPYPAEQINAGQTVYASLCSACHGIDAHGMPNLGKDLTNSEFMRQIGDQELLNFVKVGRPIWDAANTTGVDMPPKGGNPALTDDEILNIIAYLRSLDPFYVPPADSGEVAAGTAGETASTENIFADMTFSPATAAPAAGSSDGLATFQTYCAACHGMDGHGLPNLGKDLIASEFVLATSDQDLLTFVKMGRPIWDAANTTGVDMPPKGGNPALTDDEILTIIAFLRAQQ